jgi:ubiquinone/menaquinone biosynthesis C-methylase UbiE
MNKQISATGSANAQSDLIQWKTDAWKDPNMVSWYSSRMVQSESTNLLKNTVEVNTIKRHVTGRKIIDIGVGTGRAALPLVADGYDVTGVDSSQAMLDETRRLAGNAPIALQVGDVVRLPYEDAIFDCAVSLNVLVHFPNWREALLEWKRVVRPGGRLIFDIHTQDHVIAACGADKSRWPDALRATEDSNSFGSYMSRASIDELVEFAEAAGFVVKTVVPYGAFFGGGNINWLLYSQLEQKASWKRTLSWFARDKGLLDLGLFIEESIVANLSPKATGRMFVVLENKADTAANARFAADIAARNQAFESLDVAGLMSSLPLSAAGFAAEFDRLLTPLRNRHFFFLLFSSIRARFPAFDFGGLISADMMRELSDWAVSNALDQKATEIARNWSAGMDSRFKSGVDVTIGVEYNLVRVLLSEYFGLFDGAQQ